MRPPDAMPTGVEQVAQVLLQARRARAPVESVALETRLATPGEAYQVQDLVAREMGWDREEGPQFWKSGGAGRAAALTHARLPRAGVWMSPARAADWHFNIRLIEAEVALRLGQDVSPALAATLTPESALPLVDAMTVSIELVDSRWAQGVQSAALLKLADLQSHGALVLGAWVPFTPRDWASQSLTLHIAGAAPQVFRGTHALGDPAWVLPLWLRHATRDGATVAKGSVVTTGTWCGAPPAQKGDRVRVVFEGIGEAEVSL